jgi:hypothetical protein
MFVACESIDELCSSTGATRWLPIVHALNTGIFWGYRGPLLCPLGAVEKVWGLHQKLPFLEPPVAPVAAAQLI